MTIRILFLFGISLLSVLLVGCSVEDLTAINPKGPIAEAERDILLRVSAIMLIVIVPVIVMTFLFAWRFRESNQAAPYDEYWESLRLDLILWLIPACIIIAIAVHVWISTHQLDPYKPLGSKHHTLEVQVVALDWKWLFIYPKQGIATVNELAFPAGKPVQLLITSDTVMNSFFIPQLAGQIYTMAGMQTQLHVLADEPGQFLGRNTQYSGTGFPNQRFQALAITDSDFESWVSGVRASSEILNADRYAALAKPSVIANPLYFSAVSEGLYRSIIHKYHFLPEHSTGEVMEQHD